MNKKMPPLVSTLICTHNAQYFFDSTILSVLDQTHSYQEILIRDDCSTDGTIELLQQRQMRDERIHLFYEKGIKRGPYGGLNFLLDNAKGKYIAIQDHDDIWHPEKLEKQVNFLMQNPKYSGCGVQLVSYYEDLRKLFIYRNTTGPTQRTGHTGLMYKKTKARYDTTLEVGHDSYFMIRGLYGKLFLMNFIGTIHRRRIDGKNLSTLRSKNWYGRFVMFLDKIITFPSFCIHIYTTIFPAFHKRTIIHFFSKNIISKRYFVDINNTNELKKLLGKSYNGLKPYLKKFV